MKKILLPLLLFLSIPFVGCKDEEYLSEVPRYSGITIEHLNKSKPAGRYCVGDTLLATTSETQAGKWIDRVDIAWTFNRGRNNSANRTEFVYGQSDSPRNFVDTLFLETAGKAELIMTGYFRSMADLTQYNESYSDAATSTEISYSTQTSKFQYYDVVLKKNFTVLFKE